MIFQIEVIAQILRLGSSLSLGEGRCRRQMGEVIERTNNFPSEILKPLSNTAFLYKHLRQCLANIAFQYFPFIYIFAPRGFLAQLVQSATSTT